MEDKEWIQIILLMILFVIILLYGLCGYLYAAYIRLKIRILEVEKGVTIMNIKRIEKEILENENKITTHHQTSTTMT